MVQSREEKLRKKRVYNQIKRLDPLYRNKENKNRRIKRATDLKYREKINKKKKIQYSSNWIKSLVTNTKSIAKRRGLKHNINDKFIKDLWNKQNGKCFWFGFELLNYLDNMNPLQPTLDRIDNLKGYTKDNVLLSCLCANLGRNITDVITYIRCLQKINLSETTYDINLKKIEENTNVSAIKDKINWASRLKRESSRRAKVINLPYELTKEYIDELNKKQNGLCYWYGVKMEISLKPNYPLQHSLDRIDSTKGYTKDNVVLCTLMANYGKNKTDPEKWIQFCDIIKSKINS